MIKVENQFADGLSLMIRAVSRFINRRYQNRNTVFNKLIKNCWSFDAVPKSFAGFELDFA